MQVIYAHDTAQALGVKESDVIRATLPKIRVHMYTVGNQDARLYESINLWCMARLVPCNPRNIQLFYGNMCAFIFKLSVYAEELDGWKVQALAHYLATNMNRHICMQPIQGDIDPGIRESSSSACCLRCRGPGLFACDVSAFIFFHSAKI